MSCELTLMSRKYFICSITTDEQPSEPLPADRIVTPNSGDTGPSYIERYRYVYRWENHYSSTRPRSFTLYKGTLTPLPSEIQLYRNSQRKIVAIFSAGDQIQPPDLSDSQIPYATVVILREYLWPFPPPAPQVLPQLTQQHAPGASQWQILSYQPLDIQASQGQQPPLRQDHPNVSHAEWQKLPRNVTDCVWTQMPEQSSSRKRRRQEGKQTDAKRFRRTIVPSLIGLVAGIGLGVYHSDAIKHVVNLYT